MESTSFRLSSLFFFFLVAAGYFNIALADDACLYTIKVKTGNFDKAGTDSRISLELSDENGKTILIPNLVNWGEEGPNYPYFQWGSFDTFKGRGNCINVCRVTIKSDCSGSMPRWYLSYLNVATRGIFSTFEVNQWLQNGSPSATRDNGQCYAARAGETRSANHKVHTNERSGPTFDILRALE